jgi:hypothetical protein
MVDSADEARRIAALATAALRLVNETAATHLVAAADRGETRAQFDIGPVQIPASARLTGRLYDQILIEALEQAGEASLARACRVFVGLGFALATVPKVEREDDVDRVTDVVRSIRIDHLELGFAAAQEITRGASSPLLQAVALPAAHLWRARAEAARLVAQYERKALATIAAQAEKGADSCRLPWREFSAGAVSAEHLQKLGEALRGRGFRIETVDAGTTLRVSW